MATTEQEEMIKMILTCCPATVFRRDDGVALVLADDNTWLARVYADGDADTTYLSTIPIAEFVSVREDTFTLSDLNDLEGFEPGWEC